MDFKDLVTGARSCRRFVEKEPVDAQVFEWLVDCARLTPSARNQQALRYVVVNTPEARETMRQSLVWAGALREWDGPEDAECPAGYIVLCVEEGAGKMVHIDSGIAAQTIQLAAASRGLGACIFLSCDPARVLTMLHLPEPWQVGLVLAIGAPGETRIVDAVPASGERAYWRDEQNVHHVPKLPLSQIFLGYR